MPRPPLLRSRSSGAAPSSPLSSSGDIDERLRDIDGRLREVEYSTIALHQKMDFLILEATEQRAFRQRATWALGAGMLLLLLQNLGLDVTSLR